MSTTVKLAARAVRRVAMAGALGAMALTTGAQAGIGQTVGDDGQVPNTGLDLPSDLQIFGKLDPNIRKPTAIVNDTVITGTDVDQRVALIAAANGVDLKPEDRERLRLQVLRQLIDETLEIQQAKTEDVEIKPEQITKAFDNVAKRFDKTPAQFRAYLRQQGSSDRSMRRQIEGELAWSGYLRREVEPRINVGDEEVQGIIDRLKARQGTEEYHLAEIYMNNGPDGGAQTQANMQQLMGQLKEGKAPFDYYARQFSESSTAHVGGDLDWVDASQLPAPLAQAAQEMQIGQVAGPIPVAGGYSILYLVDKRKVLEADPRDAQLSLKQLTISFPKGTTQAQASARASEFAKATQAIKGCGGVEKVASSINAEVVDNDSVHVRDLPPQLQSIMLQLQVGQATPPFGSPETGVRALVLCGRDDAVGNAALPNAEQLRGQLEEQRVNLRAQQMLRDLRRDAIIEYQ